MTRRSEVDGQVDGKRSTRGLAPQRQVSEMWAFWTMAAPNRTPSLYFPKTPSFTQSHLWAPAIHCTRSTGYDSSRILKVNDPDLPWSKKRG
jgi:hypothetical protein